MRELPAAGVRELLTAGVRIARRRRAGVGDELLRDTDSFFLSLDASIGDFFQACVRFEKAGESSSVLYLELFWLLERFGCDYFDLLARFPAQAEFDERELAVLVSMSPEPKLSYAVTETNVRRCTYRWTPSKYHSDTIGNTVRSICSLMKAGCPCLRIYHSNRNEKNPRAADDKYILLITKSKILFLDVCRKYVFEFEHRTEEPS